jgi:hypothetical protein
MFVMMELTADQKDACSGIALLYMGPERRDDEDCLRRLMAYMECGDVERAARITAGLLLRMATTLSPDSLDFAAGRWEEAFDRSDNDVAKVWLKRIQNGKTDLDLWQLAFWVEVGRQQEADRCPCCGSLN